MSCRFHQSSMIGVLTTVGMLYGCASNPPPNVVAQMTRAETSIAQAEQAGAEQGALKDLQQAKTKQANAQEAFNKHDYKTALRVAEQAQVDAQFALARAQTLQEQQAAADAQKSIDALRREATQGG